MVVYRVYKGSRESIRDSGRTNRVKQFFDDLESLMNLELDELPEEEKEQDKKVAAKPDEENCKAWASRARQLNARCNELRRENAELKQKLERVNADLEKSYEANKELADKLFRIREAAERLTNE